MQKHYMSGQLKKGLYSTSKSVVMMDRRLEKADKKINSEVFFITQKKRSEGERITGDKRRNRGNYI